jgi:CheY-like chemotaxis protein
LESGAATAGPKMTRPLRELLENEGSAVAEAVQGAEALDEVDRSWPGVIILDLVMPDMGGWTFARSAKGRGCGDVPIVLLSAADDLERAAAQQDGLGLRAYLHKPFDVGELIGAVRRWAGPPLARSASKSGCRPGRSRSHETRTRLSRCSTRPGGRAREVENQIRGTAR